MNTTEIFKALGDEVRLDLVRHLAKQAALVPSSDVVGSCSEALHLAQPTMSHHLKKLVTAGIIREQKVGKQKFYQLESERLQSIGIDVTKL
jgi:ArsR family transcriptional regulator